MSKLIPVTLRLEDETDIAFLRRIEWEFSPLVHGLSEAGRLAIRKLRALVTDGIVGMNPADWVEKPCTLPDPRQQSLDFRPEATGRAAHYVSEEAERRALRCVSLSRPQRAARVATWAYGTPLRSCASWRIA